MKLGEKPNKDQVNYKLNLEQVRQELLSNLDKKSKNWKEFFNSIESLEELKQFYEKQKITFTIKKKSSSASLYFFEFINAFLKFENQLDDRSKTILAILIKNLKEINEKLALKLEESIIDNNLKNEIKTKIIKNNDWEKTIYSFDDINKFLLFFSKQRLVFSHKKSIENIENYYIPFIITFIRLKEQWLNTDKEEKIYKAIILIEANILDLDPDFDISNYLDGVNYEKYVKIGISERKSFKRWKDFFGFFKSLDSLEKYYDKVKTTFSRKVKQNDIDFFKYFILSLKEYINQNQKIDTMIFTLVKYYKQLDIHTERFLNENNINLSELSKPISFKIENYDEIFKNINTLNELLRFYSNQSRYFTKKSKQNNKKYFELFIQKFEEFINQYDGEKDIIQKLKNIEKYLKMFDSNYKLPEKLIIGYQKNIMNQNSKNKVKTPIKREKVSSNKKLGEKLKKEKLQKIKIPNIKQHTISVDDRQKATKKYTKPEIEIKNNKKIDFKKEYKILLNNLQNKGKRNDGKLWYELGIERFVKLINEGYDFKENEILILINYFKINDVYKFYKEGKIKDSSKIRLEIVEKTLILKNLLSIDKIYFDIFKNLLENYLKNKKIEISSLKEMLSYNDDLVKYLGL